MISRAENKLLTVPWKIYQSAKNALIMEFFYTRSIRKMEVVSEPSGQFLQLTIASQEVYPLPNIIVASMDRANVYGTQREFIGVEIWHIPLGKTTKHTWKNLAWLAEKATNMPSNMACS